jgi:hypothetical protein
MACTALVPTREFRIDPALVPALFASVGVLPERRAWFDVRDDTVSCCLVTVLAATYSNLKTACNAEIIPNEAGLQDLQDATGLPFPVPYLMGLVNGWDGLTIEQSNYDQIREADEKVLCLFEEGRQDGMAAFAVVSAILSEPAYPLASATAFDLYASEDEDEDEDDAEEFEDEWDDSENAEEDDDEDEDDDWDEEDDI